jgi:hypothetical protein
MAKDGGKSIKFAGSADAAKLNKKCWGIDANQNDLAATTSVSINQSMTSVEAKNNQGEVVGVLVYDKRADISIEGIAESMSTLKIKKLGETLKTLEGTDQAGLDTDFGSSVTIVTECSIELSNEDWKRFTIKGNMYQLVTKDAA